ncbi:MAG: hypothetical protein GHCLOJNM_00087 [bacterium]|nr:hypothetical protein [bacterium]
MRTVIPSLFLIATLLLFDAESAISADARRPNIVLIMTDDQGYGDFGFTGNPVIGTPNLDRLAGEAVFLTNFYVSPVCTPTRACLMTGRYNYRTRAIDTYRGRAMMDPEEITIAEILRSSGYKTGIFGKWHLGDCFPMRAMDQGFEESLVLRGGGLRQPSDPPESGGYFDPILFRNGEPVQTKGYCTDIFTDAALEFVEKNREQPFFLYLPYNCPHTPLLLPDEYYNRYKGKDLSPARFPATGYPIGEEYDPDVTAKVYGMVTNIDDNIGRMLAKLDELHLAENTVVVFLTDNGPQQTRYKAGFRGHKASVYEGGIHVPCLVRWKGKLESGKKVDTPLAHIDMTPTLLEVAGVRRDGLNLDGRSFVSLLVGGLAAWDERTLFFQWHRGDKAELYRAFAARGPRYKLVQAEGTAHLSAQSPDWKPKFELFDLLEDPYETKDLAAEKPEIAESLKKEYEAWFQDVSATRGYDPPRIVVGDPRAKVVNLTRQDWRGSASDSQAEALGWWELRVTDPGPYKVTLLFDKLPGARTLHLSFGGSPIAQDLTEGVETHTFEQVALNPGDGNLEAWTQEGDRRFGVKYIDLEMR